MAAYLTATRALGGAALTAEQIRQALAESRVVFGILEEAIDQAVAVGEASKKLGKSVV